MKYKSSSKKWTKKFKAAFISIALGFVLAVSGALTAIGVSLNNGRGGDRDVYPCETENECHDFHGDPRQFFRVLLRQGDFVERWQHIPPA